MQRKLARRQNRLQQVRRVHDAAGCGTGADDRVNFVDEQNRVRLLLQIRQQHLEAFFEVAAILRAREQRAEIERVHGTVGNDVGNLFVDDALRETFGDRGFANAGLTDQQRIVLAATAQHLDHAFQFGFASNQRIDAALARLFVEIRRERFERARLSRFAARCRIFVLLGRLRRTFLADNFRNAVRNVVDDVDAGDVLLLQEVDGLTFLFAEDRDQHLCAGNFLSAR